MDFCTGILEKVIRVFSEIWGIIVEDMNIILL